MDNKHVFKWAVRNNRADGDGSGCIPDSSDVVSEDNSFSVNGCCGSVCQDLFTCTNIYGGAFNGGTCACRATTQCDDPGSCIHPGPTCDVETFYDADCGCCKADGSPIIIDLANSSLQFVAPSDGLIFDLFANRRPVRVSWPANTERDAYWLALDRNKNGRIDDASELFGNATRLHSGGRARHGYEALAEFDLNKDGQIDTRDPVFHDLRLWRRPLAEDGVQRADVILPLAGDVAALLLQVQELTRRDRWGNTFRYRAIVTLLSGQLRWSYDVFLKSEPVNTVPASQVPRK